MTTPTPHSPILTNIAKRYALCDFCGQEGTDCDCARYQRYLGAVEQRKADIEESLSTAVAEDASPITIEELSARRDRYQDAALSAAVTSRWRFFYAGKADAYNDLLRELQNQTQE